MFKCYFFLPIAGSQLMTRREELSHTLSDVLSNIIYAGTAIQRSRIHVHINGAHGGVNGYVPGGAKLQASYPHLYVTSSLLQDKITAVNYGLSVCRRSGFDLFFNVDNDIRIPAYLVRQMTETFVAGKSEAIVCEKAPLTESGATEFQKLYSLFVALALENKIFPNRRPTGSFYCIDPNRVYAFPPGASEGDYLAKWHRVTHTESYVYSAYPQRMEDEVARRKRIAAQVDATCRRHKRDIQDVDFIRYVGVRSPFPREIQTDPQFRASYGVFSRVIEQADQDQ